MKKIIILLLAFLLFISMSGCSKQGNTSTQELFEHDDASQDKEIVPFNQNATSDNVYTDYENLDFSYLSDKIFYFSSGVGAWGTEVQINADGTFDGYYLDSDAGSQMVCVFNGRFTALKKTGAYEYSMTCEELTVQNEVGTQTILDGIFTTYVNPYGFDDANEFKVYLPGKNLNELPLEYKQWVHLPWETPEEDNYYSDPDYGNVLTAFGLYNERGKQGFIVW